MVVHAGLPSIANIKDNYAVDLGLVSFNIANLMMEKVNKRLDLPSIQTACTTGEEHPNQQAEQEAVQGYALMKKYANVPMSLADACLVRMSEQIADCTIYSARCRRSAVLLLDCWR